MSQYSTLADLEKASSVSLPSWDDNIGYEEGQERVISKMSTGYPRYGPPVLAIALLICHVMKLFYTQTYCIVCRRYCEEIWKFRSTWDAIPLP